MSTANRRRVLRPQPNQVEAALTARKLAERRAQLQKEQDSLVRWMTRLKRAFRAFEKQLKKVSRLEKHIARLTSN